MTVSAQGLKVRWVVVPTITVFVVNVELTDVYWYKPTLLTFCAFMSSVWIDAVVVGSLPYCATAVPTSQWVLLIS